MSDVHDQKEKQTTTATNAPPVKKSNRHKQVTVVSGPTIVMDMQWDDFMNDHLQKKVISQVSMAYSFDKMANNSIPMVFTSVNTRWRELLHRVNAFSWNKKIVTFNQKSLLESLPRDKLVYLTADTDNVCQTLDTDKFYIIGCILDHNSKKGATREFALEHGIRMERLPIAENITMEGRHVLTINHVAEILIRVANGADWATALIETIPPRKNAKRKGEVAVAEEEEAQPVSKSWCDVA